MGGLAPGMVRFRTAYAGALAAGVPVLLAFHIWHWYEIAPVWATLRMGALFLPVAALPMGWAWWESRRAGRFAPPWGGLAWGGMFAVALTVGEVVGMAMGRFPRLDAVENLAVEVPLALIPSALLAAVGWRLAGWRGGVAYLLASLLPLMWAGGAVGVGTGATLYAAMLVGVVAAGVVLGVVERLGTGRVGAAEATGRGGRA